ncbi:DNA mismatch repair endonuclease MutL [Catalinimonas niigatensis]|uniref:DNA mismatch repair endonuclease MutL n=1 Tax=Catalinimonas niigatensis TaxID=1397264 RepID=UPI0026659F24|nr:DNA mismatch repair endonuclease MutL [Catalinimonas niigatensis]WPP53631.1 DNA mismatch repair endonuclease MutL [Catalinimonas niigatensis]
MSDVIQLLPDAIANQIAAGEVVQRPASVVKELLENAIDASSDHICVIVKDAGKGLIQVKDNGTGMSETDARMSFARHATSKIRRAEDIYAIHTLGFRGEALASIAAVAQVEMVTRTHNQEFGTCLSIEGSSFKDSEPVAAEIGTSISVKNLFFNVPARRTFLKSNAVEMRHIMDEFFRVALARPDISFEFYQNDTLTYNLAKGKLSRRIAELLGDSYRKQILSCQEETPSLKIYGYIGMPEHAKRTRGEQFFFINSRFIKNSYLNHAVMSAYEAMLPEDSFPFYALFIEIDPAEIDVNVHPTKTEIKLADERTVYAIIRAAVKRALGTNLVTPSLDEQRNEENHFSVLSRVSRGGSHTYQDDNDNSQKAFKQHLALKKADTSQWESMYHQPQDSSYFNFDHGTEEKKESENALTFQSAANRMPSGASLFHDPAHGSSEQPFQIHQNYIMIQVKSGMMIIDQQAAHERILYEHYSLALERRTPGHRSGISQQTLFPQTLLLNPSDLVLVQELREEINALGFDFTIFGQNTIVINGVPTDIKGGNEKEIFEGLIEQYKSYQSDLSSNKRESVARSIARRMAVKRGQKLNPAEMSTLIDRLFGCLHSDYAPDGRKTYYILELDQISGFFK